MKITHIVLLAVLLGRIAHSQTLSLPPRPADAPTGSEFALSITNLERPEREERICAEIERGNVPNFLRKLSPVHAESVQDGITNTAVYYVTPDYLAVGSDEDYFLTPLSPITAQKIADRLQCLLPTPKMVDEIYAAAPLKLSPAPIAPSAVMATVPIFIQHNETIRQQRDEQLTTFPLGTLVAGHKKDVVISNKLLATHGKVAIYGWHKLDGKPIQPLYCGHADFYADYSHGIRLVQLKLIVNGVERTIPEVLADPALAGLLSDEGPILKWKYPPLFEPRKSVIPTLQTQTNAPGIK
jgi:hypothetical protein